MISNSNVMPARILKWPPHTVKMCGCVASTRHRAAGGDTGGSL